MKRMSVLAILVLAISITAFSVAGTYAKYTSTDTISDKARVARWNINELVNVSLFEDTYNNGAVVNLDDDTTVTDVIAPGTKGSYNFKLTGDVETNYTIKANVKEAEETNGLNGRVVYYLKDGDTVLNTDTSLAGLKSALEALYDGTTIYAAGSLDEKTYTIEWEWVFEKTTTVGEDTVVDSDNDLTDTELGNKSAEGTNVPEVKFTVDFTVTQSNQAA
ncbi:MAG: hypothetical protein IJ715_00335 [Bacilli bacterium]|nr:hypothetical protein [Bacilli bacterium]